MAKASVRLRKSWVAMGTVSEGTLKVEDLIAAYLNLLEPVRLTRDERKTVKKVAEEFRVWQAKGEVPEAVDILDCADDLVLIIEDHVPPLCTFRSTEGDGALFMVQPDWDYIEDLVREDDLHKGPHPPPLDGETIPTYWLEVNDHGNATLWLRRRSEWVEQWAVV